MKEDIGSQFDYLDDETVERRALLPIWIKVFCWIFMFFGLVMLIVPVFMILDMPIDLAIYGLATNNIYSWVGVVIVAIFGFKAFSAYSLWFEKDNAIVLSKIDAIVGIVICIAVMIFKPMLVKSAGLEFRIELILLIPYYLKLNKIEYAWDNGHY